MKLKKINQQIRRHYEIEKKLADRLKNSTMDERKGLYRSLYNELFNRVPWHPLLMKKEDEKNKGLRLKLQLQGIQDYINRDTVFMEIGSGDCSFAFDLTGKVKKVYAIDVSDEIVKTKASLPNNFQLIISDGISIKVPDDSVDVAYSNQLIEHLHPDDITQHFQNVSDALKKDGKYIFLTPHRFRGPHDVSKYFDQIATGFHLKEWTFSELIELVKGNGFSSAEIYSIRKGIKIKMFVLFIRLFEFCLNPLPYNLRKKISNLIFGGQYYIVAKNNRG